MKRRGGERTAAYAIAIVGLSAMVASAQPVEVVGTSFTADSWVRPQERIRIELDRLPDAGEGGLAVFVGDTDVTSQFEVRGTSLVFVSKDLRLPPGEQEITIWFVESADEWTEVATMPIRVLTRLGFETAGVTPRADLSVEDELAAVTADLGVASEHARWGTAVESDFDFFATTERENALQFNERAAEARKFDLQGYRLGLSRGTWALRAGDVVRLANPLLVDETTGRGLHVEGSLADRVRFAGATVNGQRIVGFDNFFGLSDFGENNVRHGTVGVDLVRTLGLAKWAETLGAWSIEATVLDGEVVAARDFNTGEIVDAEQNFAWGMQLRGAAIDERFRADVAWARSEFDNPDDPLLAQGAELVDVEEETDEAIRADVAVDVLRDLRVVGDHVATLTATGRFEKTDPLYRTVAAFVAPDQETDEVALLGSVGPLFVQARHAWIEDNLDDVPTILKTKTRNLSLTADLPVRSVLAVDEGRDPFWVPEVTYAFDRVTQRGVNRPDPELSGFDDPSQIPDQVVTAHQLGVTWFGDPWGWALGYRFIRAAEDNRQTGREAADFEDLTHEIQASIEPLDRMFLTLLGSHTGADAEESGLERTTRSTALGVDWEVLENWFASGNYSYTDEDDSEDSTIARTTTLETQLAYQIQARAIFGATPPPIRVFVRHSYIDLVMKDRVADVSFAADDNRVDGGVSFSF